MIVKAEPAPNQDVQDIQPPPPEYSETPVRPEPTSPQRPTPAAQTQYPPRPSPHTPDNFTPQQREAQTAQAYRDRCKRLVSLSSMNSERLCTVLAQCANGDHDATTTFGLCGIICAVLLFPIGLVCLW